MKATHWLILAGLAVGGYFVWKNRAKLIAAVAPDPTVQTLAGSTYGGAQDVNGNIGAALNGMATGADQAAPTDPALNLALTSSGAGLDAQGSYA